MSLTDLNQSRSSTATASGAPARTARATAPAASRSQVRALSSPVLESVRESLTSWACRRARSGSVANGNANSSATGLLATPNATSTARHSSVTSLYSGSRPNWTSRTRMARSAPLTAVSTRTEFTTRWITPLAATTIIQAKPCRAGSAVPMTPTASRWKTTEAAR